jgi:hypothetical protein
MEETVTTDLARQDEHDTALAVANREDAAGALAHVLGTGDLYQLTNEQRVAHYLTLCESLSLNALSRPFQWIEFQETKDAPPVLTLYFKPAGAAQMLRNHHVSVHYPRKEIVGELFVCEAVGHTPDGRKGTATKYVPLTGKYGRLTGRHLANAFMSAESGALRRLALAMFGLSSGPDADEVANWRTVTVDGNGRVVDNPTREQRYLADTPAAARAIGEPTFESVGHLEGPPLAGTTGQEVRTDELERPRPDGPRPSFRASDEDVKRRLGAWFAAVKGTSLDGDEARHRFVGQWTSEWPEAKRTDSLRTMFARMTDGEAAVFLAYVRAICDEERSTYLEDAARHETASRPDVDQRVHDAVQLTGGPAVPDDDQADDETAL